MKLSGKTWREIYGKETLREDAKWAIPENIHTFTMDGFLEFRGQGMGTELELET